MLAGLGVRYALFHLWEGGLGDRQIARRRDRDEAVVTLVYVQLAIDRDVVHARIGAGVGHHHQPRLYQHPHATGHVRSLKTVTATAPVLALHAGRRTWFPPRPHSARRPPEQHHDIATNRKRHQIHSSHTTE